MKYKGYEIEVCVAVCNKGTLYIIDEFDNMREAKRAYNINDFDMYYLAAEIINEKGDVNPACWGKTKKEAVDALKKVLV